MNTLINIFKNKNRANFFLIWIGWFVRGILDIVDGIVNSVTLCFYNPNLSMKWVFWITLKQYKSRKLK